LEFLSVRSGPHLEEAAAAPALYDSEVRARGADNPLPSMMERIVTHWSLITGRDL
jgi:hypothetical protein